GPLTRPRWAPARSGLPAWLRPAVGPDPAGSVSSWRARPTPDPTRVRLDSLTYDGLTVRTGPRGTPGHTGSRPRPRSAAGGTPAHARTGQGPCWADTPAAGRAS